MKKLFTLILLCAAFFVKGDSWVQKSGLQMIHQRMFAFSFAIKDKGYVGGGWNYMFNSANSLKDVWEYNSLTDTWMQKSDMPVVTLGATGFAINDKGYACGSLWDNYDDCWQFNPDLNTWVQKSSFGNHGRWLTCGFVINNVAYLGTGDTLHSDQGDGLMQDFWKYDSTDNWTQVSNIGGLSRCGAVGFAINGKGYVCAGVVKGNWVNDLWEYQPKNDTWSQKANLPAPSRGYGIGFSIGDKGYFGTGKDSITYYNDFWEYDPVKNIWIQKADFPGHARYDATAFTIQGKGYLTTGYAENYGYQNDLWEYTPDSITDINEITPSLNFSLSPNPIHNHFNISFSEFIHSPSIVIYNNIGEKVFEKNVEGVVKEIPVQFSAAAGVYFLKVKEGERERVVKVAVE